MVQKEQFYAPRKNKQGQKDKRLIFKIVKEIQADLPFMKANRVNGKTRLH